MKTLKQLMREHEKLIVTQTLSHNENNRIKSAKVLGITPRSLEKILERHRISKRRFTKPLPIPVANKEH